MDNLMNVLDRITAWGLLGWMLIACGWLLAFGACLNLVSQPSTFSFLVGVLGLLGLAAGGFALIRNRLRRANDLFLGIALLVALMGGSGCGYSRIEPGHVGIKVHLFGGSKGVDFEPVGVGAILYNPWTTSVYEYPTYVQTAQWAGEEQVSFNTREGMVITANISLSYYLQGELVPEFFAKFRTDDLHTFTHGFMRNTARDAFNEEAVKYTVEQIYGEFKETFMAGVRDRINTATQAYGVVIEQFGFIGAPTLPESVVTALNAKITATQKAIQLENELRAAEAEAKKAVAAAQGMANAKLALAKSEAEANRMVAASVTPELIQWHLVQRWDGKRPMVEGQSASLLMPLPAGK